MDAVDALAGAWKVRVTVVDPVFQVVIFAYKDESARDMEVDI